LLHYNKKIFVPQDLREQLMEFYHIQLMHPGYQRQLQTMKGFYWPQMSKMIYNFTKQCIICKRSKLHGGSQDYAKLPAKTHRSNSAPFDTIHIDLLGPFNEHFYALVIIEAEIRWLEIGIQDNRTAITTAYNFEKIWLCRYPRPFLVVHDQGPEFMGDEFQELLTSFGISSKPITKKNPQANALVERINLQIANSIRTRPDLSLDDKLQYAAYAIRTSWHSILNATPGQLLYGQDMITRQLHFSNWNYLSKRRLQAILQDNDRENLQRLQHFYQVGDQIMLRIPKRDRKKEDQVASGPFIIKQINQDGTVLIDKGISTDKVHLRNIFPV
jgi:hypothetical protein